MAAFNLDGSAYLFRKSQGSVNTTIYDIDTDVDEGDRTLKISKGGQVIDLQQDTNFSEGDRIVTNWEEVLRVVTVNQYSIEVKNGVSRDYDSSTDTVVRGEVSGVGNNSVIKIYPRQIRTDYNNTLNKSEDRATGVGFGVERPGKIVQTTLESERSYVVDGYIMNNTINDYQSQRDNLENMVLLPMHTLTYDFGRKTIDGIVTRLRITEDPNETHSQKAQETVFDEEYISRSAQVKLDFLEAEKR